MKAKGGQEKMVRVDLEDLGTVRRGFRLDTPDVGGGAITTEDVCSQAVGSSYAQ
jgi:hypothetical protein